jgi:hypothetical protein
MKQLILIGIFGISAAAIAYASFSGTDSKTQMDFPRPTASTIAIILDDKHWTVDELNTKVLKELWESGQVPKQAKLEVSVRIRLHDTNTLCTITYSQNFDQPFWRVDVGYDGKIRKVSKRTMRER